MNPTNNFTWLIREKEMLLQGRARESECDNEKCCSGARAREGEADRENKYGAMPAPEGLPCGEPGKF